jgi:hypothetical protein
MRNRIRVICCEGASGSSMSYEDQIYGIAKTLLPRSACVFKQIEHSWIKSRFKRNLRKAFFNKDDACDRVLIIAKSQGADRALSFCNRKDIFSRGPIALVTVDPHHWFKDTVRDLVGAKQRIEKLNNAEKFVFAANIYQQIKTPTGYAVRGMSNTMLTMGADHWSIPHAREVERSISAAYKALMGDDVKADAACCTGTVFRT